MTVGPPADNAACAPRFQRREIACCSSGSPHSGSTCSPWRVYAGYPLMAWLAGGLMDRKADADDRLTAQKRRTAPQAGRSRPHGARASRPIAAFNEAPPHRGHRTQQGRTPHPADLLDVIVISDASDDGTDTIVRGIGSPRVRLIRQEPRRQDQRPEPGDARDYGDTPNRLRCELALRTRWRSWSRSSPTGTWATSPAACCKAP